MKLVIKVSDDTPESTTAEAPEATQAASSASDGLMDLPAMDGGPVPEILLSMESEVAAGQRSAPHLS